MPKDGHRTAPAATVRTGIAEAERIYRCARCGAAITRGRWEMALDGAHERAFFNPLGVVFRILCFREAPGATDVGAASTAFTWFPGYAWRVVVCRSCSSHLGWRYEGSGTPPVFFGLIKPSLTLAPE